MADSIAVKVSGLALAGTASGNYTLTQPTTTANITAAPLTVTGITAGNKVYDGNDDGDAGHDAVAVLVGVVGGDDVTAGHDGCDGCVRQPGRGRQHRGAR